MEHFATLILLILISNNSKLKMRLCSLALPQPIQPPSLERDDAAVIEELNNFHLPTNQVEQVSTKTAYASDFR